VDHERDHKRIGVMYMLLGLVMLLRAFRDAIMSARSRPSRSAAPGISPADHYDQIFRARHDHDSFRGDAACYRADELVRAVELVVRDVAFPC